MADRAQWEYLTEEVSWGLDNGITLESALNALGQDGWEAVGMYPTDRATRVLLKRPVLDEEAS